MNRDCSLATVANQGEREEEEKGEEQSRLGRRFAAEAGIKQRRLARSGESKRGDAERKRKCARAGSEGILAGIPAAMAIVSIAKRRLEPRARPLLH